MDVILRSKQIIYWSLWPKDEKAVDGAEKVYFIARASFME
jgi:hypothetical protein